MVDVPLQIINPPSIQQNVRVEGGTNWDLSRSAVPTPIQQLPDPEPVVNNWVQEVVEPAEDSHPGYTARDGVPASTPTLYQFAAGKAVVAKADQAALKALSKKVQYVVVGHAAGPEVSPSKLAWSRANSVAAALRRSGHKVLSVKAFSSSKPRSTEEAANRRVEVYPAGAVK